MRLLQTISFVKEKWVVLPARKTGELVFTILHIMDAMHSLTF